MAYRRRGRPSRRRSYGFRRRRSYGRRRVMCIGYRM